MFVAMTCWLCFVQLDYSKAIRTRSMSMPTLIMDKPAECLRNIYSLGSAKLAATEGTRITAIITLSLSLYPVITGLIYLRSFLS